MSGPLPTEAEIRSHRRWLGPVVVGYKKLVRWLIRPYLRTVFEAHRRELEARDERAAEAREAAASEIAALRRECRRNRERLAVLEAGSSPEVAGEPRDRTQEAGGGGRFAPYYPAFLEHFGPPSGERRQQLEHYAAILEQGQAACGDDTSVVDLACGRGELLALLAAAGVAARGIDANAACVAAAREQGLEVRRAGALELLREQSPASLGGIACLGLVEHLSSDAVVELLELCHSRMASGAALLVETVNPLSLAAIQGLTRDPTARRLLHPETVRFLLREIGFPSVDVQFLQPAPEDVRLADVGEADKLNRILFGCEAYVVIAHL